MIEVLFGESEAAAMKAAKTTITDIKTNGPVSVWIAGNRKPPEKNFAGWIPGTSKEVILLGFMLDIGNIREPINGAYRKDLISSMYGLGLMDTETDEEFRKIADVYVNELVRLERYLENGEPVRIWYSDAPYAICGLYNLCRILQKYDNDISVVKLPEYRVREESISFYHNWGEISAEELAGFLLYEQKLSKEEVQMYSVLWNELVEDNSFLRVSVNGKVIGVPEDFYDFVIWKKLTEEPIKEGRLIGNILGYYQISIGHWWYAGRINYYIEQGKIKVVEDSENKYSRTICLA